MKNVGLRGDQNQSGNTAIGKLILSALFLALIGSCSTSEEGGMGMVDDDPMTGNPQNNAAPINFNLIAVADGVEGVELKPTLSWEASADPEGGQVLYDLYLGKENPPIAIFAADIDATTFSVQDRLQLIDTYYWNVMAKDADGNATESNTFSFTTRDLGIPNGGPITTAADFSERRNHTAIAFQNKLWVIGGVELPMLDKLNDVWYSDDGDTWTLATASADFSIRRAHTTVVFDDKLWVIGGLNDALFPASNTYLNDVWYSSDGVTWTEATPDAGFAKRAFHTSAVFDDKIWVIGGVEESSLRLRDVWYSSDGVSWTEATSSASFQSRGNHTTEVFDDKLWVMGGFGSSELNDVWYSSDGANWTEATGAAAFPARTGLTSVVLDDKLWVVGGFDTSNSYLDDVWHSNDGISWLQTPIENGFKGRLGHTTTAFDNKIWLIAGDVGSYQHDVWALE